MFENLSERLSGVFDRLTKQGALSEEDVKTALREVRVALLEADVSLSVAREFVKRGSGSGHRSVCHQVRLRPVNKSLKSCMTHSLTCCAAKTIPGKH